MSLKSLQHSCITSFGMVITLTLRTWPWPLTLRTFSAMSTHVLSISAKFHQVSLQRLHEVNRYCKYLLFINYYDLLNTHTLISITYQEHRVYHGRGSCMLHIELSACSRDSSKRLYLRRTASNNPSGLYQHSFLQPRSASRLQQTSSQLMCLASESCHGLSICCM